jgi:hypothetical protein
VGRFAERVAKAAARVSGGHYCGGEKRIGDRVLDPVAPPLAFTPQGDRMKQAILLLLAFCVLGCSSSWGQVMECSRVCNGEVREVVTSGNTVECYCSDDLWIDIHTNPVQP